MVGKTHTFGVRGGVGKHEYTSPSFTSYQLTSGLLSPVTPHFSKPSSRGLFCSKSQLPVVITQICQLDD